MRDTRKQGRKSPKADEERTVAPLYDFLYKDSPRLASYYAQLFAGRLVTVESTNQESEEKTSGYGASAANLVKADAGTKAQRSEAVRTVVDPHDMMVTDVLRFLKQHGLIRSSIAAARNGELISAKGRLTLFDSGLIKTASAYSKASLDHILSIGFGPEDGDAVAGLRVLIAMMDNLEIPSTFTLSIGKDLEAVGIVSPAGMQEPITSYNFKHGSHGLADVYLIGIKEESAPVHYDAEASMAASSQQVAEQVGKMMFSASAIRVTPLVLFRQLN